MALPWLDSSYPKEASKWAFYQCHSSNKCENINFFIDKLSWWMNKENLQSFVKIGVKLLETWGPKFAKSKMHESAILLLAYISL